jgi:anti-anti-sigma factor
MSDGSAPLDIQTDLQGDDGARVAVVRLDGEVDLANADEVEAVLLSDQCISAHGVVLDLLEVPFMDSSGLRVLLLLRERHERVALVLSEDGAVHRLLGFAEMADSFPIHASTDDAVAELGAE